MEENKIKRPGLFHLSVKQIIQIALFLAALIIVEFSCMIVAGATWVWFIFDWYYGTSLIIIYILCARITGFRFAILILGVCESLLGLFFGAFYGGPIFMLYPLSEALALQIVFLISRTNGENLKSNMLGGALFGLVGFIFFFVIIGMLIVGKVYPIWFVGLRGLSITITSAFGGFLAYKIGNKIKGVV